MLRQCLASSAHWGGTGRDRGPLLQRVEATEAAEGAAASPSPSSSPSSSPSPSPSPASSLHRLPAQLERPSTRSARKSIEMPLALACSRQARGGGRGAAQRCGAEVLRC